YAGAFPTWLAPVQVKLLPIGTEQNAYAHEFASKLEAAGMRVEVDDRNETIGYKIREARLNKIPYRLVIGAQELENGTVSVGSRDKGDLGAMSQDDFFGMILEEIRTKARV
ncbi:MAG: threonine--tRNA ligase, partial [Clostridia bacterium]|nr:threonine--tRNA ligase [Clostridia bacterium]